MNNLPIETYESVVQQRDSLAVENLAMKAVFHATDIPSEWTDVFGDTEVINHDSVGDDDGHSFSCVGNSEEVIKAVLIAAYNCVKTPVTDEFTRELMAKCVDRLLTESFREEIAGALADFDGMDEKSLQTLIWSGQPPEPDGDVWCVEYMTRAAAIQSKIRDFAAQLRKEINDAQ